MKRRLLTLVSTNRYLGFPVRAVRSVNQYAISVRVDLQSARIESGISNPHLAAVRL